LSPPGSSSNPSLPSSGSTKGTANQSGAKKQQSPSYFFGPNARHTLVLAKWGIEEERTNTQTVADTLLLLSVILWPSRIMSLGQMHSFPQKPPSPFNPFQIAPHMSMRYFFTTTLLYFSPMFSLSLSASLLCIGSSRRHFPFFSSRFSIFPFPPSIRPSVRPSLFALGQFSRRRSEESSSELPPT
jgi:hypothetical protein